MEIFYAIAIPENFLSEEERKTEKKRYVFDLTSLPDKFEAF